MEGKDLLAHVFSDLCWELKKRVFCAMHLCRGWLLIDGVCKTEIEDGGSECSKQEGAHLS